MSDFNVQNTEQSGEAANAPSPDQDLDAAITEALGSTDPGSPAAGTPSTPPEPGAAQEPAPSTDAAAPPVAGDAPPAGSTPNDIWSTASPELRAAHDAEIRDATLRLEGIRGRQSASDREVKRLRDQIAEINAARQDSPPAPQQGQQPPPSAPAVDLQKLREEYPEVAGPLIDVIMAQGAQIKGLEQPLGQLQARQAQEAVSAQAAILTQKHPDWNNVVTSDADRFAGWLQTQPRAIQEAMNRNFNEIVDGEEAALVVGLYKSAIGIGTQPSSPAPIPPQPAGNPQPADDRRARQMAAGRDAGRTGPSVTTGIPDDFDAAVDAFMPS